MIDCTRIQKFINKKLNQHNNNHGKICPSCNEIESNDHISSCTNDRVIHLYKADYNGFLKILWPQRAAHNATEKNYERLPSGGTKGETIESHGTAKRNEIPLRTTT
jgi:hypothetical protein